MKRKGEGEALRKKEGRGTYKGMGNAGDDAGGGQGKAARLQINSAVVQC